MKITVTASQIILNSGQELDYVERSNISKLHVRGTIFSLHFAGNDGYASFDYKNVVEVNGVLPTSMQDLILLLTSYPLNNFRLPVNDGDSVPGIPIGISGIGSVYAFLGGQITEYASFIFEANGGRILLTNSAGVSTSDDPNMLCILQNNTLDGIEIKNNTGVTLDILISLNY